MTCSLQQAIGSRMSYIMDTMMLSSSRAVVVQMVFSSALVRCAGIPLMVQVSMRITPSDGHVCNPHPVGHVTLGDILEILPFDDPIVVLELDGETIWAALESSLETWPSQEG